jgi:hypothetical protein
MIKQQQTFNIRETAETLVPDKVGRVSYAIALLMALAMAIIITLLKSRLPLTIPLYFTFPWGEARLAPQIMLYLLPATNLILGIFNLGLGRIVGRLSPLLPKVLSVSTMVVAGMLTISLIGIIQSLIL